jgi:hypothetical protein
MFKTIYLVTIISINKKATIDIPYTNFISLDIPHHDKPEHIMDPNFVSLLSLPKFSLLLKTAMKP